jgi:tetratricopeptide (TPR) repeat protein
MRRRNTAGFLLLFLAAQAAAQPRPAPPHPSPAPELKDDLKEIATLIEEQKYGEALKRIDPLVKIHPETSELVLCEVAALEGLDRHEECQIRAKEYLSRFPASGNRDQVLFLLGASLVKTSQRADAVAIYKEALQITQDPSLKKRVESVLRDLAKTPNIGIRLGGKPPASEEESQSLRRVGIRILEMALADYKRSHEQYPEKLSQLLEGEPPVLRTLPEDPAKPGETFEYKRQGETYHLGAAL